MKMVEKLATYAKLLLNVVMKNHVLHIRTPKVLRQSAAEVCTFVL